MDASTVDALCDAFADLRAAFETHRNTLNLSFGLEYSSVVDWVADITPRRGHPRARCYGQVWRGQASTPDGAIQRAIRAMRDELDSVTPPPPDPAP